MLKSINIPLKNTDFHLLKSTSMVKILYICKKVLLYFYFYNFCKSQLLNMLFLKSILHIQSYLAF